MSAENVYLYNNLAIYKGDLLRDKECARKILFVFVQGYGLIFSAVWNGVK